MNDGLILSALQQGVIEAVAQSDAPTFPVKYVGRTFTPPDDQKWLELVWLPNNAGGDFIGDEKNYRGALRLILHWPNDDAGAYEAIATLSSIAAYFTKGLLLQSVQIYETPDLTGTLEQGTEMLYPATLRYQSYQR